MLRNFLLIVVILFAIRVLSTEAALVETPENMPISMCFHQSHSGEPITTVDMNQSTNPFTVEGEALAFLRYGDRQEFFLPDEETLIEEYLDGTPLSILEQAFVPPLGNIPIIPLDWNDSGLNTDVTSSLINPGVLQVIDLDSDKSRVVKTAFSMVFRFDKGLQDLAQNTKYLAFFVYTEENGDFELRFNFANPSKGEVYSKTIDFQKKLEEFVDDPRANLIVINLDELQTEASDSLDSIDFYFYGDFTTSWQLSYPNDNVVATISKFCFIGEKTSVVE